MSTSIASRFKHQKLILSFGIVFATFAMFGLNSAHAAPRNDFDDISWIGGKQRHIYGTIFTEPADEGIVKVYVAGPVDASDPLDDVTLDPHYPYVHDHVTTKVPFGHRKIASFLVLKLGPNGNASNVHTRTVVQNLDAGVIEPEDGSFVITPTREAPYEINLGNGFFPLTSVEAVESGIAAGLLQTVEIATDISITGWSGGVVGSE